MFVTAPQHQVAGSIYDGVLASLEVTQSYRPHSVVLGSTQPLTEWSTKGFLVGKGGWCLRLTTLPSSCADCLKILEASKSWTPRGLSGTV